ncbi:peptidylprolyl isomerase [Deferribacter autotrophicus]|uniref:Periplasmic chaperone PpiD n=1 Tax=Deferribacter autotrophicus TaxID=500465 RepID=A0A5A8F538_9BACT|nr:SurA N-terminal domain-containing protein [Deferribacter autotrophicus]KAA0259229.1 peptidylprolyl isomerase [Deferribacter autotrophicus]
MLRVFREKKRLLSIFLWLVIAAFIGTIFLVWGMGGKTKQANFAIKVNDYEVSFAEYQKEYENFSNTLKSLLGGNLPDNLDINKQVIDGIVEKYLLIDEANKKGVFVSDIEVLHEIQKIPSFQTNGKFDGKRYMEVLKLNRMTPSQFERSIRTELIVNKMKALIENSVFVNEDEIKNEYNYRNTVAKISYIKISSEKFKNKVKYTDSELKDYFEKNKENYRVPEKIKVKYIMFDPEQFNKTFKATEEEIEKYYLQHPDEFQQKEEIAAKHILIRVKDWKNKNEVESAKKKISDILAKIKKGEKFEDLAKKYSEDPSAKNGGDLGYFTKGQMIKEFEDATFKLKKGEISDVVKTPVGFHIIKVYDYKPEKKLTLDEAKEQIIEKLKTLKKNAAFNEYVFNTYRDILKASNITAYALENKNIKVYETGYFSIFDNVPPIGNNIDLKNKLFRLDTAEITNIVDIQGVKYIFELEDRKDSYIPEFNTIKDEVTKDFIDDKAVELARQESENFLKKYKTINEIADKEKYSVTTTPYFKRTEPIPDLGINTDLSKDIFTNKGKLLSTPYEMGDNVYIISVIDVKTPDYNKITKEEKDEIKNYILNIKQNEALSSYIDKLRNQAKIEINPAIITK